MPTVIVDGQEIELAEEERLNGIQVAAKAGVDIPRYCWHPGLSVVASCRMCLVETGKKDPESGKISMMPKLVPACQTPATDGTVFVTNSDKVNDARAMVEEDLLIRHPIDCPICDKAGECYLQDYHFEHGRESRRADLKPFTSRRRPMGDTVTLFVDRCVMCTRCVRFTREITGSSELMVINRGAHEEIDVFPGFPLDNKMSGNVVDLCPVGALGDVDFLYEQRVWFMKKQANVCAGCSTGCSIFTEQNQDQVYRLKPRENEHVNQWWMCDEGRYGWHHLHSNERLTQLRRANDKGVHANVEWEHLPEKLSADLKAAGRLAVALSPLLTVEEAYLLAKYARSIDPEAIIGVGHIPIVGEDETFLNGFTIRAEKCPNRRGVESVAAGLQGELISWEDLPSHMSKAGCQALWVTGGYKKDWIDEATAAALAEQVELLIVEDMFASPLWERATWQIPSAGFAEKAGSFVNANDWIQSFSWAIRPPQGVMSEGQLYWRLAERQGLYQPAEVLQNVARAVSYFSAIGGEVPELGMDLKVNLLAGV